MRAMRATLRCPACLASEALIPLPCQASSGVPAKRLQGRETEVIAAYRDGASVDALAARFGVSNSPVRRILIDAGVERRPTGRQPAGGHRPDLREIADGYAAGESVSSLARLHDCNPKTMRRWLADAGVKVDPYRRRSRSLG